MSVDYVGPQPISLRMSRPSPQKKVDLPTEILPIIAVDPGGMTGWSLLVLRANVLGKEIFSHPLEMILRSKVSWNHGEINCLDDENYGVYQLCKLVDEWPSAVVVFEGFFVRQIAADLSPVRITAAVQYHLWTHGRGIIMQQASMAKRISNERLKLLGCYTSSGGLQHARDADRHVVMFVRRCMKDGLIKEQ
jgi:hypothetical protein